MAKEKDKSLESWIWDAACSIRGAKDAAKYKDYILPLIFTKRLCDVFDDEVDRIAKEVGSRKKAFLLTKAEAVSQKIKTAFGNFPNWQNYVIVHELLHFSVPNHGKLWKSLMTAHLGDYKEVEERLAVQQQ